MALQSSSIDSMQTFLGKTYHIPDYQREYSWEKDELGDFWEDLETTKNDPDGMSHFFGQIVVHCDGELKYIIDGQQRTITSVIFLRVLQSFYEEIFLETQNPDADEKRMDITSLCIGRYTSKGNRLHLILNAGDGDYFRECVQVGKPNATKKEKKPSQERIRKAYWFFHSKLAAALDEAGASEVEDRIEYLDGYYDVFLTKFNIFLWRLQSLKRLLSYLKR